MDEDAPESTWGITFLSPDECCGLCVARSKHCDACAYCWLAKLHSSGARLPCSGPRCQGDASFGAPGGLCTECGHTKCATVGGCPHLGMAPRGYLICSPCVTDAETPQDRKRRLASEAASSDPQLAKRLAKLVRTHDRMPMDAR